MEIGGLPGGDVVRSVVKEHLRCEGSEWTSGGFSLSGDGYARARKRCGLAFSCRRAWRCRWRLPGLQRALAQDHTAILLLGWLILVRTPSGVWRHILPTRLSCTLQFGRSLHTRSGQSGHASSPAAARDNARLLWGASDFYLFLTINYQSLRLVPMRAVYRSVSIIVI